MSTHPKALEAAAAAEKRAAEREQSKKFVADLTRQGVRFLEIHPRNTRSRIPIMTIAYMKDRHSIFAVANAICHPDEQFDKVRGRAIAGIRLADQHAIILRKPASCSHLSDTQWLDFKFREY